MDESRLFDCAPGKLKLSLLELYFSGNQFVLQFHDDPVFNFLPLRGNAAFLFINALHQPFQPRYLLLAFSVELFLSLELFDYFSEFYVLLVDLKEFLLDLEDVP